MAGHLPDVPKPALGVRARELGDELLLYFEDGRGGVSLNGSAAAVWELCDGERRIDDIVATLAGDLGMPVGELAPQVNAALSSLLAAGLLEAGSAQEPTEASRPRRRAAVRVFDLEDEALLWVRSDRKALTLNRSARQIWEACDGGRSVREISRDLASRSGEPEERIAESVAGVLRELAAAGAIELTPGAELEREAPGVRVGFEGLAVSIAASDPKTGEAVARNFRAFPAVDHANEVARIRIEPSGDRFTVRRPAGDEFYGDLEICLRELERLTAASFARERSDLVWLHGGGVAREGRALLLVGRSGGGKSTLVHGLVAAGWRYLSDETLPVDARAGHALPFPTTLRVRIGDHPPVEEDRVVEIPKRTVPLEPAAIAQGGQAVAALVFPGFGVHSATELRPLSPAECARRLLGSCQSFSFAGEAAVEAVVDLARRTGAWSLSYSDGSAAVELLAERFREL